MRDPGYRIDVAGCELDELKLQDSELRQHDSVSRLPHTFDFDRRGFFKVLGGGLLVCLAARHAMAQESGAVVHHDHCSGR